MTPSKAAFTLSSPDIADRGRFAHAQVLDSFGCSGQNISPALEWSNPPEGTKSYALMVHDPDAPTGSGWWHWIVHGIPASVTSLPAGAGAVDGSKLPAGAAHGPSDFGTRGYGGPCPPEGHGDHHYHFRLYALGVEKLDLPPNASAALIGFNVRGNALGVAELTALYSR